MKGILSDPKNFDFRNVSRKTLDDFFAAKDETFCDFVENFYKNFKISAKDSSLEKNLQNMIKIRVHNMNLDDVFSVLSSITTTCKYAAQLNKSLIETILNRIILLKKDFSVKDIRKFSNYIKKMNEANVDYLSYFNKLILMIPPEKLENSTVEDLVLICEVLAKIGMQSKFFDVVYEKHGSIYKIIEEKVESLKETFSVADLFKVLKCFVINDRGNEDLIRFMEKKIFSDLKSIDDKALADIPYFYHKRIMFSHSYIQECIMKPTYLEFLKRFNYINPLSKTLFIINYWKNSTLHGMYYDYQLKDKIKEMFANKLRENYDNFQQRQHMMTVCLSYLSHARQIDPDFLKMYTNLVKDRLETLNSNFFLKSGVFLSRYQETDSFFWENFLKHLPEMLQNKHNLISLYSIHLNLRLKDKKNFEIISPRFDENLIKNAREKWKEVRNNEVKLTKISHTHNKIRIILEKKKVNFVIEYYDEYFVDIALPDSKICIEVNGPGHYLFPDVILNGRTENKRQNMEKLGWKLFSFPYFYYDDEAEDAIENFVNQIIPLCS